MDHVTAALFINESTGVLFIITAVTKRYCTSRGKGKRRENEGEWERINEYRYKNKLKRRKLRKRIIVMLRKKL